LNAFHHLPLLAVAFILGACSALSDGHGWTKADTNAEQAQEDLATCQAIAHADVKREAGISQDIEATQGNDMGLDVMNPSLQQNLGHYSSDKRYAEIVDQCMAGLGYSHAQ